MGIFGKLFSRKKRDEDEAEEQGYETDIEPQRTEVPPWSRNYEDNFSRRQPQPFQQEWQQPQQQPQQQQSSGTHEIILAKLDVINAKLDSLNQRLANLERYAAEEEKSKPRW